MYLKIIDEPTKHRSGQPRHLMLAIVSEDLDKGAIYARKTIPNSVSPRNLALYAVRFIRECENRIPKYKNLVSKCHNVLL